jgi:hypothetical protein
VNSFDSESELLSVPNDSADHGRLNQQRHSSNVGSVNDSDDQLDDFLKILHEVRGSRSSSNELLRE